MPIISLKTASPSLSQKYFYALCSFFPLVCPFLILSPLQDHPVLTVILFQLHKWCYDLVFIWNFDTMIPSRFCSSWIIFLFQFSFPECYIQILFTLMTKLFWHSVHSVPRQNSLFLPMFRPWSTGLHSKTQQSLPPLCPSLNSQSSLEVLIYPQRYRVLIINSLVPESVVLEIRWITACLLLFLELCFCGILLGILWKTFEKTHSL